MPSQDAVTSVWTLSLVLFAVVGVVVAALLTVVWRTARRIHATVADIWTVGKNIANNTVHVPLLLTTNRVAGGILAEAGGILAAVRRIRAHAETCSGCPDCVIAPRT